MIGGVDLEAVLTEFTGIVAQNVAVKTVAYIAGLCGTSYCGFIVLCKFEAVHTVHTFHVITPIALGSISS